MPRYTSCLILLVVAGCATEHGQVPEPDATPAPLACDGTGFFRLADVESCIVADVRADASAFPFDVQPAGDGFVKIHDVFTNPAFPSVVPGTYFTPPDGGCQFEACRANTVIHTCSSLGCTDASQLDDPACVQTGAQCACHAEVCAAHYLSAPSPSSSASSMIFRRSSR